MRFLRFRTAVITGAASGIGRALAIEMAAHGMHLALVDINEAGLAETQRLVGHVKQIVSLHVVDVSNPDALEALPAAVLQNHRTVDVLVNNAGVTSIKSFHEESMADFDWVMTINVRALVHGTKVFLPHLMRRPEAHIINISSIFGIVGVPGQTSYCASKFAVRGFSEALQEELLNTPIGVTVVHPGGVATQVVSNARANDQQMKSHMVDAFQTLAIPASEVARQIVVALQRKQERLVITREAVVGDWLKRIFPVWGNRLMAKLLIRFLGLRKLFDAQQARMYESLDHDGGDPD